LKENKSFEDFAKPTFYYKVVIIVCIAFESSVTKLDLIPETSFYCIKFEMKGTILPGFRQRTAVGRASETKRVGADRKRKLD
jgi:hypothetical protein